MFHYHTHVTQILFAALEYSSPTPSLLVSVHAPIPRTIHRALHAHMIILQISAPPRSPTIAPQQKLSLILKP